MKHIVVKLPSLLILFAGMVNHTILGAPYAPSRSLAAEEVAEIRERLVGFGDLTGAHIVGRIDVQAFPANSTRTVASIVVLKSCRKSAEYCVIAGDEFGGECRSEEDVTDCAVRLSIDAYPRKFVVLDRGVGSLLGLEYSDLVAIGEMAEKDIGTALAVLLEALDPATKNRTMGKWPFVDPVIFDQPMSYLSAIDFHSEVGYQRVTGLFVLGTSKKVFLSIEDEHGHRIVEFFRVER
jgi:hypothetical protein